MTKGACGVYFGFPQLLEDLNLLKEIEVGRGFTELYYVVQSLLSYTMCAESGISASSVCAW